MIGPFSFYSPAEILFGKSVVKNNSDKITSLGKKAYIITYEIPGKHQALEDIVEILDNEEIDYIINTTIEENPSVETVEEAANYGKIEQVDFIIAIGGGSPIDAAKAIGILINNPRLKGINLFDGTNYSCLPIVAIPTTAGTGAEVARWSVLTRNDIGTKQAISPRVIPQHALLDPSYLMGMPDKLTLSTAIDALCHNIESYMSTNSSFLSRKLCEISFDLFSKCVPAMKSNHFPYEIREKQMVISLLGGIVNSQTGSGIAHGMSYALTHEKSIPHGLACGLLEPAYLKSFKESDNVKKVQRIVESCGFDNTDDFSEFIHSMLNLDIEITIDEIEKFASDFAKQEHRFARHPEKAGYDEVFQIYKESLLPAK